VLPAGISKILISEEEIAQGVQRLANQISLDYSGKELVLVGVLKGAFIFLSDLAKRINIPVMIDFAVISSYGGATKSSGCVKISKEPDECVSGRHVIIVEDIVDTGLTLKLSNLAGKIRQAGAVDIRICSLLNKPDRRCTDIRPDYTGFDIPDKFVVGYGLDYNGLYRNLPYIGILEDKFYSK
jgi:hypoxanthine phosphoribosyltransferase